MDEGGEEFYHIIKVQAIIRKFLVRCHNLHEIKLRYEKIYDPTRQKYYYYDKELDKSSWFKPVLLLHEDISDVAPTYTPDEAATKIQSIVRRNAALLRMRLYFKKVVVMTRDETSGEDYYYNTFTGETFWNLPKFMNGTYDYEKKNDADTEDEEEDDISLNSEQRREKKRLARKYPRSKMQEIVDEAVDHIETTTQLDLSNMNAKRVTSRIYDLFHLEKLILHHNQLTHLNSEIQYFTSLNYLDISFNQIHKLPEEISELKKLVEFNMKSNKISNYNGSFYRLRNLKKLDLSYNRFKDIPMETGNLELLKELGAWDVGISLLTSLMVLDISHCQLTDWPTQLEGTFSLSQLNLSYNQLTTIPESKLKSLVKLKVLDISHNKLEDICNDIYQLAYLEELNLSYNELTILPSVHDNEQQITEDNSSPDDFEQSSHPHVLPKLHQLKHLDMSYNQLTELNSNIEIFSNAVHVNFSHNRINSISTTGLSKFYVLQYFNLSYNQLTIMPDGLSGCKNLFELYIQHNDLNEFPMGIISTLKINLINLSHNQIPELPGKVLAMLNDLTHLELQYNLINGLPLLTYSLKKLIYLDLNHNKISILHPEINQLSQLTYLDVSYNELVYLPNTLGELKRLEILELRDNELVDIPNSLIHLTKLRKISLIQNDLKSIPSSLRMLPRLIHWNISWNLKIVQKSVDWVKEMKDFDSLETHPNKPQMIISLPSLSRKIDAAVEMMEKALKLHNQRAPILSLHYEAPTMTHDPNEDADSLTSAKDVTVGSTHTAPTLADDSSIESKSISSLPMRQLDDKDHLSSVKTNSKLKFKESSTAKSQAHAKKESKEMRKLEKKKQLVQKIFDWQDALRLHYQPFLTSNASNYDTIRGRVQTVDAMMKRNERQYVIQQRCHLKSLVNDRGDGMNTLGVDHFIQQLKVPVINNEPLEPPTPPHDETLDPLPPPLPALPSAIHGTTIDIHDPHIDSHLLQSLDWCVEIQSSLEAFEKIANEIYFVSFCYEMIYLHDMHMLHDYHQPSSPLKEVGKDDKDSSLSSLAMTKLDFSSSTSVDSGILTHHGSLMNGPVEVHQEGAVSKTNPLQHVMNSLSYSHSLVTGGYGSTVAVNPSMDSGSVAHSALLFNTALGDEDVLEQALKDKAMILGRSMTIPKILYHSSFHRLKLNPDQKKEEYLQELEKSAFLCYFHLGKLLLTRSNCIKESIRLIEKSTVQSDRDSFISCMDIAQRNSEDMMDITEDTYILICQEIQNKMLLANKSNLFTKKKDTVSSMMSALRPHTATSEKVVTSDEDTESEQDSQRSKGTDKKVKEGSKSSKRSTKKSKGLKKVGKKGDVMDSSRRSDDQSSDGGDSASYTSIDNESDTRSRSSKKSVHTVPHTVTTSVEKEEETPEIKKSNELFVLSEKFPIISEIKKKDPIRTIPYLTSMSTLNWLVQNRLLVLTWASKCMDCAYDILQHQGWGDIEKDETVRISLQTTYPEWIRKYSITLLRLRAEIFQSLQLYYKALCAYRGYLKLIQPHDSVEIKWEMIKIYCAVGDYKVAEYYLKEYLVQKGSIGKLMVDKDGMKFDSLLDLTLIDKDAAVLMGYVQSQLRILDGYDVFSDENRLVYHVQMDGLKMRSMDQPVEVLVGNKFTDKATIDGMEEIKKKKIEEKETSEIREDFKSRIEFAKRKIQNALNQF